MSFKSPKIMRRRALQISQTDASPLYLFTLTGEDLDQIAEISRISRNNSGKLIGYQRPEVKKHIQQITDYLNGDDVLFPNSIIIALSSNVRFVKSRGPDVNDGMAVSGILEIPLPGNSSTKPAWIVDGQQRAMAISKCNKKNFPIPVNAFVSDAIELQRDQFLRVNNTKPLPKGLITELLPEVSTQLPSQLAAKKIPSAVCDLLNLNKDSPFHKLIRRSSTEKSEKEKAIIADTSIVKMIEESLVSPSGCLFPYRNIATGETDFDGIYGVLVCYWNAVRTTFSDAWGLPPSESRLMHGAGIRAMGRLMDRIMPGINFKNQNSTKLVCDEIQHVVPICRWNKGNWEDLNNMCWNEIQNVPRHIRVLSNFIIRSYIHAKAQTR
jgi:DGQHR domain-containing protein